MAYSTKRTTFSGQLTSSDSGTSTECNASGGNDATVKAIRQLVGKEKSEMESDPSTQSGGILEQMIGFFSDEALGPSVDSSDMDEVIQMAECGHEGEALSMFLESGGQHQENLTTFAGNKGRVAGHASNLATSFDSTGKAMLATSGLMAIAPALAAGVSASTVAGLGFLGVAASDDLSNPETPQTLDIFGRRMADNMTAATETMPGNAGMGMGVLTSSAIGTACEKSAGMLGVDATRGQLLGDVCDGFHGLLDGGSRLLDQGLSGVQDVLNYGGSFFDQPGGLEAAESLVDVLGGVDTLNDGAKGD